MKQKHILRIIIAILAITLWATVRDYNRIVDDYNAADNCMCETCAMFNEEAKMGALGIYFQPDYICIWTENRTAEAIQGTLDHEATHHLIYLNYNHYCEGRSP